MAGTAVVRDWDVATHRNRLTGVEQQYSERLRTRLQLIANQGSPIGNWVKVQHKKCGVSRSPMDISGKNPNRVAICGFSYFGFLVMGIISTLCFRAILLSLTRKCKTTNINAKTLQSSKPNCSKPFSRIIKNSTEVCTSADL